MYVCRSCDRDREDWLDGDFDGYWLFKHLMEIILTDGHGFNYVPVNAVFKS